MNLSSYFVKNSNNLIPNNKYIIKGEKFRFEILSPRLIRLEYNRDGIFEDRATSLVVNRKFPDFIYNLSFEESYIRIDTEYFNLIYVKDSPLNNKNIKITIKGTNKIWYPGVTSVKNLGSIKYSLDDNKEKLVLDEGLYSFDGFAEVDDSKNYVINDTSFENRITTQDIYLFAYNQDLGLCLQDYFNLTGYPELLPRYALGCWWYKNDKYNMEDIDNILKDFSFNEIPLSVFLLGDKWHNDTCNYLFDNTLFDYNYLNRYFIDKNIKFGLTIDPSKKITPNDPLYNNLLNYINPVKNEISLIPLDNNKITTYLNIVLSQVRQTGIKIYNINYYNEKDKLDLFLLNHYHYVMANSQERGVILSRNPGIAPHRYPIIYSGKTKVNWNTLKNLATYNNSLANMGVSWQAHAIGGYYGGIENAELYLRYIQFGVFNPIFILASEGGKYYKREPWKWNAINLSVIKKYINLRNQLVPYIYNEGYMYHKYGIPLIQPLYYKYPKLYDEPNYINEYFFGSKIMISPIIKKKNIEMNRVVQKLFIPNGIWYDFLSGKKFIGNKYYTNFYRDEDYPIFIREGSIIPLSLDEDTNLPKNMELQIFPAENGLFGSYELYEDDGISKNSNYIITTYNLEKIDTGYSFTISKKEGNYNIPNRNIVLRFRNMKEPESIQVKSNNIEMKYNSYTEQNDLVIELENVNLFNKLEVLITGNNLEIENLNLVNKQIEGILDDLEVDTTIKEKIDKIIFSDLPINKKRIGLRKLKKDKLEPKYINMFISLLEISENK